MARGGWWLTASDHVVSGEVPAPPGVVRDFYCNLHNIVEFHPLVVSVHTTGRDETADSYTQTYRVEDRIPFGRFTMAISYTARVHVPTSGDVLTEARQFPQVRLHGKVSFDAQAGGTRVTERLRIEAPRPFAAITVREAMKAHVETLEGLRQHFQ